MASKEAVARIKSDEGFIKRAKNILVMGEKEKNKTIGWGYNLSNPTSDEDLILSGISPNDVKSLKAGDRVLSKKEGEALFKISLQRAEKDALSVYPDLKDKPKQVRDVVINMSFQLGRDRLADFTEFKKAVDSGDYVSARSELKDSLMFKQTKSRTSRHMKSIGSVKSAAKVSAVKTEPPTAVEIRKGNVKAERSAKIASLLKRKRRADKIAELIRKQRQLKAEPQEVVEALEEKPIEEAKPNTEVKKEEDINVEEQE